MISLDKNSPIPTASLHYTGEKQEFWPVFFSFISNRSGIAHIYVTLEPKSSSLLYSTEFEP